MNRQQDLIAHTATATAPKSMPAISFFVSGTPRPQPRARSFVLRGKGGQPILTKDGQPILRVNDPGTAEAWKQAVALAAKPFIPMVPLQGPLRVDIEFFFPRPKAHCRSNGELKASAPYWHTGRGDVDNLWKSCADALTTIGMWDDDGQVCAGFIQKHYAEKPGAAISIYQLRGDSLI